MEKPNKRPKGELDMLLEFSFNMAAVIWKDRKVVNVSWSNNKKPKSSAEKIKSELTSNATKLYIFAIAVWVE